MKKDVQEFSKRQTPRPTHRRSRHKEKLRAVKVTR